MTKHIVIRCREPHYKNVEVLHPDSRLPRGDWTCGPCLDALDEQMAIELARRESQKEKVA